MIEVRALEARMGSFSLQGIDMEIPEGRYGALMGPTGCGKTTILEIVCGLRAPKSGRVSIGGEDVTDWTPSSRGIGYVPQDGALFSKMTVEEHLEFALRLRKWDASRRKERVRELSDMLRITHLLSRRPLGLSGGERQRVALGRALSFYPRVLCLDEPLAALDEDTRDEVLSSLRHLKNEGKVTVLHVTHSHYEAREMADVIYRLKEGRLTKETSSCK